jgi:hypothetical protein
MPEFIGVALGAAIAIAVLAVAHHRWGWASDS